MGPGIAAIERLRRIPPQARSYQVARSSLALVREYLRRVGEWAELSDQVVGESAREVLFADLAGLLLPEMVVDPQLSRELERMQMWGKLPIIAANYVRWQAAAGHRALAESGLWEPYEPLIRLAERGGELFTHHGFVHVEHGACLMPGPLHDFARLAPLYDLHDGALDKIDRSCAESPDVA